MGNKYTEAQKRATREYMKDKHTFKVIVNKEREKQVKEHAASKGESVNRFINRAIDEAMEKEMKLKERSSGKKHF